MKLIAGCCKGITKKGTQCQALDVFENGFCKHHGGEGMSVHQYRTQLNIEKWRRRANRLSRKYKIDIEQFRSQLVKGST